MLPKAAIQLAIIPLFLAAGFLCVKEASSKTPVETNSLAKSETPLSYNGRIAASAAQELAQQKKYAEALIQAENAVRFDPKSGTTHLVKAYVLDMLGETKKAHTAFGKAISLSPGSGYIRYAYANHLCDLKNFTDADENYLLAANDENYPFTYKAYESAAECAYKAEKLDVSEAHARSALAIAPESIGALAVMAQIMHRQSRSLEARAFIQRREDAGSLDIPLLQLAQQIEKSAGNDRAAAQYKKQLDIMLQAQIQPPTGEGQKKP